MPAIGPDLNLTVTADRRIVEVAYNSAYFRADLDINVVEEYLVRALSDSDDLRHLRGWHVHDFYSSDDDRLTIELAPPAAQQLPATYRIQGAPQ